MLAWRRNFASCGCTTPVCRSKLMTLLLRNGGETGSWAGKKVLRKKVKSYTVIGYPSLTMTNGHRHLADVGYDRRQYSFIGRGKNSVSH